MRDRALVDIRVGQQRGLEIGPLARPVISKQEGAVFYVDHADRAELIEKYALDANMGDLLEQICEVDYVLNDGQSLAEAAGPDGPFDYVIASHVVEHIPDLVSWFYEIASLLSSGGILSLIVPDKRYTFDINRSVTEISEVLEAHFRRLTRPTYAQAYDFFSKALNGVVDPIEAWSGTVDYSHQVRQDCDDPDVAAFSFCQEVLSSDAFVDVHCHVFTPESLLEIIEKLIRLDLFPYEISSVSATDINDIEFFVSLRLMDSDQDRRTRTAIQLKSVDAARSVMTGSSAVTSEMGVSPLERRAILSKREALLWMRSRRDSLRSRWRGGP